MPIYDYKCNKCGLEYTALLMEYMQHAECPEPPLGCGSSDTKRQLSAPAVRVQGVRKSPYDEFL